MRLALLVSLLVLIPAASAQIPERAHEPVVIEAALAPALLGRAPDEVAAFRWTGTDWAAVPVQVDERAVIDLGDAYGPMDPGDCESIFFCIALRDQVVGTFYTDAGTFIGPDPNAALDADDEIALLGADAGPRAPDAVPLPPGATPGTLTEIELTDGTASGYLYLTAHDGSLDPSAGQDRVRYAFDLLSGDYLTTYDLAGGAAGGGSPVGDALGANPEDTTVETDAYRLHFSDRWILDGLRLGEGADFLDRRKVGFSPGDCDRHETTGSRGEGAFVVNRDGPVRALRSVVGFNSGPLVQRTDVFYPGLWTSQTDLRVHSIPGILDVMDYTEEAVGMVHRANTAPDGATVDGDPDPGVRGGSPLEWETLVGTPGSLVIRHEMDTSTGLIPKLYWADNDTSPPLQCTGDEDALGQSGPWLDQGIPNTDPRLGSHDTLRALRTTLLSPVVLSDEDAADLLATLASPLAVTVSPVVTASSSGPEAALHVAVGPNPAHEEVTLSFSLVAPGPVRVAVVDALGREVVRYEEAAGAGAHRLVLDLRRLAPGLYLVRVETETGVAVRPITRL